MADLRPCPFCGATGECVNTRVHWVICAGPECEAEGPVRNTREGAIEAWNTRLPVVASLRAEYPQGAP